MLIKNALIVDYRGARKEDVLIEEGKIVDTGRFEKERDNTVNAEGKILMPSFCNMHTHIGMTFLRNKGEGLTLHEWLNKVIWPYERKAKEIKGIIYISALVGITEALRSGITCINDMYFNMEEVKKAVEEAGIKALLTPDICIGNEGMNEVEKLLNEKSNNIKIGIGCHSIYTCKGEMLEKALELSKKKDIHIHIHVAETRKELFDSLKRFGKRPVEYLDEMNFIYQKTILAHASWVTKREIRIIGERKATVVHNPTSNLKLATGGIMPFEEYVKVDANTTIGTDSVASNNSMDMFEAMKTAGLLQKHKYWNASSGNPSIILKSATYNGFKALGFKSGLIEKGYNADLILLKPDENMHPLNNPLTAIVYSGKPYNVEKVWVNGKIVYEEGEFPTIDKERVLEDFNEKMNEFAGLS